MEELNMTWLDQEMRIGLREAGAFAKREFEQFSFSQVQFKGENDPFTFVDVTVENMLKAACAKLIPGSGFITEEASNKASKNGYAWIIDPIDGTTNFTHGVPHFCISVALAKNDELLLGYIYHPIYGDLFHAEKGKGATLNDQPIVVSKQQDLEVGLIATGFPYANHPWRDKYVDLVMDVKDNANGLRRMGSAALDLAYVACGRYEAYFEYKIHAWDIAAGALILQEAGGKVTSFEGSSDFLHANNIVASNGAIHEPLLQLIRQSSLRDVVKNV